MSKAVFWDFDGTLAYNTGSLWSVCVLEAVQQNMFDCAVSLEEIRPYMKIGFPWHSPWQNFRNLTGERFWEFMFLRFEQIYCCLNIPKKIAQKASRETRELILQPERYQLFDDTIAVLSKTMELGYQNYILSNNYPELEWMGTQLGLAPYIKEYIVSANVGYDKPRREIFEYAKKIAGAPLHCIMVGDNPQADIQGASTVGMETVLVHAKYPSKILADHVCSSLLQIIDIL